VRKILLADTQSSTRFTCEIARAVKAPLWCHELKEFRNWLATLACRWQQNICTLSFSKLIATFGLHTHIHELSTITHLTHDEKVEADVRIHKSEDMRKSTYSQSCRANPWQPNRDRKPRYGNSHFCCCCCRFSSGSECPTSLSKAAVAPRRMYECRSVWGRAGRDWRWGEGVGGGSGAASEEGTVSKRNTRTENETAGVKMNCLVALHRIVCSIPIALALGSKHAITFAGVRLGVSVPLSCNRDSTEVEADGLLVNCSASILDSGCRSLQAPTELL
jgi:hypothetical protein